ncbi:FoF1-type ATP synthase, membrane subunit b or b' [Polaromonas sp. YR568]|uniref:DUF6600 domain-containing protein n=1 Tax=Polaromonas sp. YR568 TaxID=1855301 RepID=UPI0008E1C437|nr:DUF6600 domain-containing protein [Polaromonas sp. YR568]SFU77859.1 FoF1-type ATP synthase, membrane subunit b or b' [Polaromonas sp. YR568]
MTATDTGSSPSSPISIAQRPFRLSHLYWYLTVLAAAFLLALLQPVVWAQEPAQPGVTIDPPGRVARLNLAEGTVSFAPADNGNPADASDWSPAVLNRPLTSGDRLWTGPQSRSELYVGSTAVRMNAQTSLDFLVLDDNVTQLRLAQGTLKLRVRNLFDGQRLEVDTPNLAFVVSQPGDYRLDVDPAGNTTRVVAQSGSGLIYGDDARSITLGSRQQANFTGTRLAPAGPGAAQQDSFDVWAADRDRLEDQSVSARYIPRETVGYQQLDTYGTWSQDPAYGAVWIPREVPVQWAPYRDGHWAWVSPWGWTWVDDAPWGFAPFHYGRWAQIGPRWAWVPGRLAPRPVYAPALVAFVGGSSGGVNWNISIGGAARPGVGWFPLAPGEAFRPAYRVSPRYITQVNHNIVVNNTVNVTNVYRYQRQPGAVTAISRDDFMRGRPVRGQQHVLSHADLDRAQVVADRGALPVRPNPTVLREQQRPAAGLPPPAAVARPVVASREGWRDNNNRDERRADTRPGPAAGRDHDARPQFSAPAAPDRPEASQRAQRELQHEQREQREQLQAPQLEQQRRQGEEPIGQRALREQAQRDASARNEAQERAQAANAEARANADRRAAEQAQRSQQQAQREQERQQRAQREQLQAPQLEQQRRSGEESIGQRALREQAQRDATPGRDTNPRGPRSEGSFGRNREQ